MPVVKLKGNMSSIDTEILAITYSLQEFRLFIINKEEFLLRTDCEVIVKYFQKSKENKVSRRRWLNLVDTITGNGYIVKFEHIKGKNNYLADTLSRRFYW